MKSRFYNLKQGSLSVLTLSFLLFIASSCSSKNGFFGANKNHGVKSTGLVRIPVTLSQQEPATLNLAENSDLNLVSTATELQVSVSGCASGYSIGTTAINSGVVNLYKSDRNCLVKLESFKLGTVTYSTTGGNVVNFTTWLAGDVATFQGASGSDLIKVFVNTQVTQSGGVQTSDTVSYNFTDIGSTTTQSIGDASVSTGVPLSATGKDAPNFTITQARLLSINSNGSANVSFTLQCGSALTGSTLSTYACSTDVLQSQIDYIFIQDTYSQGAITVASATAAFGSNTPVTVGNNIIPLSGSDTYNNVVTNGGFYTSESSPLVTGSTPISSNLNNVLIIRRKDSGGRVLSFKYFYVNFTSNAQYSTPVTVCGTTFAGGAGTSVSPYLVATRDNLANLETSPCNSSTKYFSQIVSIDLGGSSNPWTSIALSGQYNGNGFSITGLYQNSTTANGLFSTINNGASVSNLVLSSVNLSASGNTFLGALAGTLATGGSVSTTSASGSISLSYLSGTGGLIGRMSGGTLSASSSSVTISINNPTGAVTGVGVASGSAVGGLVGLATGGQINNTFATGSITVSSLGTGGALSLQLGALVGELNSTGLSNSYSTGNITVSSGSSVNFISGGMVGVLWNAGAVISRCFSVGTYSINVTANNVWVGGILGWNPGSNVGTIVNSYTMSTLSVTGGGGISGVGGVIGRINANSTFSISTTYAANPSISSTPQTASSFYGSIGSGATLNRTDNFYYANGSVPNNQSEAEITPLTSSTDMEDYTKFIGFDFTTPVWKMPTSNALSPNSLKSPVLVWQCGKNGVVCP